ncbi:MAG: hypothetical protein CSA62_05835 [Planctomycetota bacterium]|nr:MAG: hypothetical protein CSA62_05835 [Planctomycetota bacterium]
MGDLVRVLLILVLLLGLSSAAWFFLSESEPLEGKDRPPESSPRLPAPNVRSAARTVIGEALAQREAMQRQLDPFLPSDEEKELWRELRPVAESQVPDPDGVGPCPPEVMGGHPALLVRRFRDPSTGYLIWEHEDHARTILQPGMFEPDPKTGEPVPTTRVITKQVPAEEKPLDPGASSSPGKG